MPSNRQAAVTRTSGPAFGELLRRRRAAAGLTQEELAERAGLSARLISDLERGIVRAPRATSLHALATALDLTASELAAWEAARRAAIGGTAARAPRAGPFLGAGSAIPFLGRREDGSKAALPVPLTSFVGRTRDLAVLGERLSHHEVRLLTLTGPPGVGKTRLALEVAARLVERYPDGVWFADLAPLRDPSLVLPAIARAAGLRLDASGATAEALPDRPALLVLDNCEHLIESCAAAADVLLQACPHLQILATSREALRIDGETVRAVPSLSLPGSQTLPPEALVGYEAVRLFVDRATAAAPHFALTRANAAAVGQVCRRLDGIPLALELAAARVRALTVEQIADRLDQRFGLLTGGSRTAAPRQQTLRAAVAWSYELLTPEERAFFARLSVFEAGWSLEAAEAVCGGETGEALDLLARLVDKSLVLAEPMDDGTTRYRLLETLRQYGQARLLASGERPSVRRRHALYYLAFAERAEPELTGPGQGRWLERLERELDNLRAALAWCCDDSDRATEEVTATGVETGLRLAGALFWFWFYRDRDREGLGWLERALVRGEATAPTLRAKALFGAGVLACGVMDLAHSNALLAQSVALSRAIGDTRQFVLARGAQGFTAGRQGRASEAAAADAECVPLARGLGEPWLLAYTLLHCLFTVTGSELVEREEERARAWAAGEECVHLAALAGDAMIVAVARSHLAQLALYEGDYRRARGVLDASVPMLRALGWETAVARALVELAEVARGQGDRAEAGALYAEGLARYRQAAREDKAAIAHALCRRADLALEEGDWAAAQADVTRSLILARDAGPAGGADLAPALEVQAALAAKQGDAGRAVRLAGAAAAFYAQQPTVTARYRSTLRRRLAGARQALGADAQAAAWAEGQAMTREQAIAYALAAGAAECDGAPCHPPE